MLDIEIIPAVLVKKREDLLSQVEKVAPFVKNVQIDMMDGQFVPNKTIGLEELAELPLGIGYEFHWMVNQPEKWIAQVPGPHLHLVHIETINSFPATADTVKAVGGRIGLVINPETSLARLLPYQKNVERIMVMAVHPGFAGQKYIPEIEEKITALRKENPSLDIEVDGGITNETIVRAARAGANKLAAATAIFGAANIEQAIKALLQTATEAAKKKEEEPWLKE